ncbi:MAG: cyclic nucleotide-binding domain-containing protein [Chloroflexi bacterium]|nr:cyclic nucleotide-binding domain-containing protein [Chloroflexota bacterium]MCA2000354.1 cyclic nucleotide-binding domain-containing protein [Chloroflexota bacterium]
MKRWLGNLLSVAPGEGQKTFLLYLLHLLFYLGLMWGDAARETLFLSAWSADDLAFVFVAYAFAGFLMGLAYTLAADRISNGLLLKLTMGVMIVWLISVRILLETNGGPRGAVYPYFYLAYSAFRDVSTMHILVYINDFYDTRASKRALPLMLSAGIAGGTLAGFTADSLRRVVGLENTPLVWAAVLLLCFLVMFFIERRLTDDLAQIEGLRQKALSAPGKRAGKGGFQNLLEGFSFIRQSGLLRGLSAATFLMVILMNLLIYQSSREFALQFAGNSNGLFNFYGVLGGISNIGGLLAQSLLLSRLVNWFGVGTMNLFFPIATFSAATFINLLPGMGSAVFARLTHSVLKQTFRNPLDAMLYNSVPLNSKTRARGFIGGFIVPLGTLAAGALILVVKSQILIGGMVAAMSVGLAFLYVIVMFNVRREYGRSMTRLLAGDEIALFNQDPSEALPPDPATAAWLRGKLQSLPAEPAADGQAVFISQILYDMDSRAALPLLLETIARRGAFYKKGVIELLDQVSLNHPDFLSLCQRSLDDAEPLTRHAAARALLNFIERKNAAQEESGNPSLLNALYDRLNELELEEQTRLVVLLLQHGSPEQQEHASRRLDAWLQSAAQSGSSNSEDPQTFAAGLIALMEDERLRRKRLYGNGFESLPALRRRIAAAPSRLKDLVGAALENPASHLRRQLIPCLARQCKYIHWDETHWAAASLLKLLEDPEEEIRLSVVEELQAQAGVIPLKPVLWQALNDPSLAVRRLACKLPLRLTFSALRTLRGCLDVSAAQNAPYRAESALYLLIQSGQRGLRASLGKMVELLTRDTYWLTLQGLAARDLALAKDPPQPGARLIYEAFRNFSDSVMERIFWLLSADSGEEEVQAVRRALPSADPAERANAAEALEATLPPLTARQLTHLLDGSPPSQILECAQKELGLRPPLLIETLQNAWTQLSLDDTRPAIPARLQVFYADGWLTAAAIHLLSGAQSAGLSLPPDTLRRALLSTLETETRPHVAEAARQALSRLSQNAKENDMSFTQPLSLIEKVIFLKEAPFFSELSLQELSVLAGISEEVSYPAEHKIFSQGDNTKSLYLVVRGRVSVQQQTRSGSIVRLKVLGAKNYFAETSLFDGAPHQADVVTIEPVDILLIRQSTLFALIRRRPDIGLSLLKALSQRLRETYAQVAQSERAKPQKLMNLYDKMEQ